MNRQLETYAAGLAHTDGVGGVQDVPADQFGTKVSSIPRWAVERMEQERADYYGAEANPANVDVFLRNPDGWACYLMFAAYIARHEQPPEQDAAR